MLLNALGYIYTILNNINSMEENLSITNTSIMENDKYYYFDVFLEGCCKKDILIEYKDGLLTLKVLRPVNTSFNSYSGNIYIQKKGYEKYTKQFFIGKNVQRKDIITAFSKGILRIAFPKPSVKYIEGSSKNLIEIK